MKSKNKVLRFFIGYLISLVVLSLISLLLLLIIYKFEFRNDYISNSIFITNILIFFASLGINVGAGNVFNPLNYAIRKIFTRPNKSETPMTYADYVEEKKKDVKNFWYVTVANVTMLVVAFIFIII